MVTDAHDTDALELVIDDLVGGADLSQRSRNVPPQPWITRDVVRDKHPAADLKIQFRRIYWTSLAWTLVLHVAVAIAFPRFDTSPTKARPTQTVISMEDIPETRQIQRPPPPPRPAVPIETESADVPDDVTIESTDLDFDEAPIDLPPPPPPGSRDADRIEEEIVEFWAVEEAPQLVKEVIPEYPEVAQKAGLEGTVFLQFVVGRDGMVKHVTVLKGPEIFREAAMNAVMQFQFKPALQNDRPVQVRMTRPIRFRLTDGG